MDHVVRAGVAVYNAGEYHAAHDAWEGTWLELPRDSDDERFLHGLIQFTAAVHHARRRNWAGACGLAESGREYLDGLPADYRGVNVGEVREYLRRLGADPERVERARPIPLTVDGAAVTPADLDFEAAAVAAPALAETGEYDEAVVERGVELAREERAAGTQTRFIALVMDFAADPDRRGLVYRRLADHVERRERRADDVEGLFD